MVNLHDGITNISRRRVVKFNRTFGNIINSKRGVVKYGEKLVVNLLISLMCATRNVR